MIRLIASDMDGTLLDAQHIISQENQQAILQAQQQNVEFIVATGRAYAEATMPLLESNINCAAICLNGAMIYDNEGNVLRQSAFNTQQLDLLFKIFMEENVFFQIYTDKKIYTTSIEQDIENYCRMVESNGHQPDVEKISQRIYQRVAQGNLQEISNYNQLRTKSDEIILKLLCMINNQQHYDHVLTRLKTEVKNIAISSSGHSNIEITHIEAQKGTALKFYSDYKQLNLSNTMAIGDNLNDLSMIEVSGCSYAMANGIDILKEAADFIAPSNIESGVAFAIKEVLHQNNS